MAIYIAFLRGINVGGKNMIKMAELKRLFEAMGFSRVQTYINSGNVLFESEEGEKPLRQKIERGIAGELSLSINVILRTAEELERVIAECPYTADVSSDGKNVNIGLMVEAPSQEGIDRLSQYRGVDDFQINGREIFLLYRQSVLESKLANNVQKLGIPVTIRNWNTMNKLASLAKTMEQ